MRIDGNNYLIAILWADALSQWFPTFTILNEFEYQTTKKYGVIDTLDKYWAQILMKEERIDFKIDKENTRSAITKWIK